MYNAKITAFGACVPKLEVTNFDLEKVVDTSDEWISQRTGIKARRIVTDETGTDLATGAAKQILEMSGKAPEDIEMILLSTCSPDYLTPNVACMVQNNIGAVNAACLDVSAACAGFVFAMSVAEKFIKAGTYKNVMVLATEVISKFANWEDRSTCVLFGDGAGGVLLERTEENTGVLCEELGAKGSGWEVLGNGHMPINNAFNDANPLTEADTYVFMDGREVFKFATSKLKESINNVLEKANVSKDEIKYFVPHQANTRIIEVVAKKLKVDLDKFYLNIDRYGNTSSASIPIALEEMKSKGLLEKGDKIVISGFGGGLAWGTMLIEL